MVLFSLGIVDKLILGFETKVFDDAEIGREWMDKYLKDVSVLCRLISLSIYFHL